MSRKSLILCFVPKEEEADDFTIGTFSEKTTRINSVLSMFFGEQGKNFLQAQFKEKPVFKIFIPKKKAVVLGDCVDIFAKKISREANLIFLRKMG